MSYFAKAFDTVPHRRLLSKIKSYNINQRQILWIQDFLCSRKQTIGVNGEFSSWFDVLSGIPLGNILGPLLFLIYTVSQKKGCHPNHGYNFVNS